MEKQYTVEELDEMFSLKNLLRTARLEREKKDGLRKLRKEVMMSKQLPERDPITAVMRATGRTRVEVLQGILDGIKRQPAAILETTPSAKAVIKALEEAIKAHGG